ncbi:ATP-binding protein [Paenibacillus uliginis]
MNIIIGNNGSGKTTLFNIILYLLGLHKNKRITKFLYEIDPELIVNIEGQRLSFKRTINDEILIEGDINEKLNTNELVDFYSSLLSPQFNVGDDRTAAIQIIRASFYTQGELYSKTDRDNLDNKIMGINVNYLKESKRQIDVFKNNLQKDEYSYEILKTYINNVEKNIINLQNNDHIKGILQQEFFNMYDEIFENKKILDQATKAYNIILEQYDNLKSERKILFNDFLNEYIEKTNGRSIREYSSSSNYSGSERIRIEFLSFLIKTVRHIDYPFLNTSGLFIVDSPFSFDMNNVKEIRKMVERETKLDKLQYIEFCSKDDTISPDWIISDLRNKGALNWLRVD